MKSQLLKLLVISILICNSLNLKAQNYIVGDVNFVLGMKDYINYANINRTNSPANLPYENIKGSPFLFEDFVNGKVKLKDGKTYEGPLRYDIYADEIEFKTSEGEIYTVINPETIEKISLNEKQFIFIPKSNKSKQGGYFEVLVEGEYLLLTKHGVILKDPVPEKPYVAAKPATFITKDGKYYLQNENSGLVEIKNKEAVTSIDPNKSNDISKFIKENKLKLSDKTDLITLVNFLNAS
jgi:hypothetical protein